MSYPDYTRDPNDSDVQTLLTASGLWNSAYTTASTGLAASAVREFQHRTGRTPMLASASEASFYFDGPDYRTGTNLSGGLLMNLPLPFVSISEVAYGCSSTDTTGKLYTIGSAVLLKPANYATLEVPIESLEFHDYTSNTPMNLRVKGKVGSYVTWPQDAWIACVMGASADLLGSVGAYIAGGATTIKDDDQTVSREAAPFAQLIKIWKGRYESAILRYTRVEI